MARAVTSLLYEQDLKRQLGLISSEVDAPVPASATDEARAAVRGRFSVLPLRDGLYLHMSDTVQVRDHVSSRILHEGLKLALVIDGQVDMTYGPHRFLLGPGWGAEQGPSAQAAAVNLRQSVLCVRRGRAGRKARAISLTLEPSWIGDASISGGDDWSTVRHFLETHLATCVWQPSGRICALAGQMLCTNVYDDPMQRLYLESRAIEIVSEAFQQIAGTGRAVAHEGMPVREQRRLLSIREWLDSGEADQLSVSEIARRFGMSASTLQRYFRQAYGQTVFEYLRRCRMARARKALENESVSVAQAATIAGYASPTNFATAMRRLYGLSPARMRSRV
ncbi:helix-turn-helix domain-containing protein [Corticimicrobacter populi]|uniref:AraC family transcriptional regulator n=1 Tax=Corticimicrobacter populi TaxID=2175229 RepID=A0A2V1K351_9BURK|nr:AraC family transcriptional regulator [Corticimicrobacter populi]PWF24648.1 AraC family transcriptional regulator [Corticimicrobacter populi]